MTFPSKRSLVNVNFIGPTYEYLFINHFSIAGIGPLAGTFNGVGTAFTQLLDPVTAYPNNALASGHQFGGSILVPSSANYSSPKAWVLAWTGEGRINASALNTWTEVNAATASSTITSGNVDIPTGTQNYVPLQKIKFGTTRGNVIAGTAYVVCSSGLTTTNIRIATTQANAVAGTFLTPSGGTGASNITPVGQGGYTKNSNGIWTKTFASGNDCYVVFTGNNTDLTGPSQIPIVVTLTGTDGTSTGGDGYVRNIRWYRLEDEDDFLAGNLFRTPAKQELVSYNPSAIRFMNWHGGNRDINCRWEYRIPPSQGCYQSSYAVGPAYSITSMAVPNQFTTSASSGTPVSMTHGEICTVQIGQNPVRTANGVQTVTGITNVNPSVASCAGHIYAVGDTVIHNITGGLLNLHRVPVVITAINAGVSYSFANPSGWGTAGSPTISVQAYVSLNVGARGAFPIMFAAGAFANGFGDVSNFITQFFTKTYYFDKNVIGIYNGSGTPVAGAWLMNDSNGSQALANGVPIEIMVALVNELNALSVSQGKLNPIHMWLNLPYRGLCSTDPDYSSGSNWATNTASVVFNGSTVNSVTYAGLTAAANLIFEYSNELWNLGPSDYQGGYLTLYAAKRWYPTVGLNWQDAQALRATCMARDVKAAVPSFASRIKFPIGIQSIGFFPGVFNAGYETYYGNSSAGVVGNWYTTDPANTIGDTNGVSSGWGTPASNVDGVCIAPYLQPASTYWGGTGAGSFTDDSAMYAGTTPYSSPNTSQAITNFLAAISTSSNNDGVGSFNYTTHTNVVGGTGGIFDQCSNGILAGSSVFQYEGGPDWVSDQGSVYGGHTVTAADSIFLNAIKSSALWDTAQRAVFDDFCLRTNCVMPAQYLWINGNNTVTPAAAAFRWAYCSPDAYASGIEGQQLLNAVPWTGQSARNLGINDSGGGTATPAFGFSVITDSGQRRTKMIGY